MEANEWRHCVEGSGMTADALIEAVARGMLQYQELPASPRLLDSYKNSVRAALSAIEANGFRVVPVEPTVAMIEAGIEHRECTGPSGTRWASPVTFIYTAMLSAVPKLTEVT